MSAMSIRMLSVFAVTAPLFTVLTGAASAQMALPGSFAVTEGGAATYEIPIEVPPGTAGVEPKLSLTYSSNGGNGLLGVGWALSGLSQISRCARTVATDGQHSGVNYDANDRFCLNGDRLVAISGTYGADGTEYRTQSEGFSRIISHGTAGNGPASFTVWTKAGLKMAFGATADSRIEAQGKTTVRLWALSQVTDTAGNYMTVTYTEEPVDGSYRPHRIDYTGNAAQNLQPYASVRFVYEARLDMPRIFGGGAVVQQKQRLAGIESYLGSVLVAKDELSFSVSSMHQVSLLKTIQHCDATSFCLPPTTVDYSSPSGVSFATNGNINQLNGFYSNWAPQLADFNGDGLSDILWDYKKVSGLSAGSRDIWLSNGDGSFTVVANLNGQNGFYDNWLPVVVDMNGDGLADLFWDYKTSDGRSGGARDVWFGNGDGSFQIHGNAGAANGFYLNWNPTFADFNGDGLTDILWNYVDAAGLSKGNRDIWISRGDGTFQVISNINGLDGYYQGWSPAVADFNGDGLADLLWDEKASNGFSSGARDIWLGDGDGSFTVVANINGLNGFYDNWSPVIADFNSDGLADVFWDYKTSDGRSNGQRDIWLGRGDGSFEVIANVNGANSYYVNWSPALADFDGDGRADILWDYVTSDGRSAGYRDLWVSNGDGTFRVTGNLHGQDGYYHGWSPDFGDFNGDGLLDVLWDSKTISGVSDGSRDIWLSAAAGGEPVKSISNGLGSTSHIEYASLAASGAPYTKDSGVDAASYPVMDLQAPAYVVSEVRADDGLGGVTTTRYRYGGLKYDHELRQTLGFRWREVEQVETGVVKRTEYRQDFPYIGRTSKTETRVPNTAQGNGGLVRSSESQYLCEDFAGSAGCEVQPGMRYFVYQNQSVEKGWDIDGTALPETTTTSTYDGYGNATDVNVSVFDPATSQTFTKTTTNTYVNPGYSPANDTWILGRLTRAEVTSTSP